MKRKKIAVVGSGVAGIVSAYLLDREGYEVALFEKNDYLGGHTHTITLLDGPDAGTFIDTGFIVFNNRNYPNFMKFLDQLMVSWQDSDMSFGFSSEKDNFYYNSYVPAGLFSQINNFFRPSFYQMIRDILRFNRQASDDLEKNCLGENSLGDYLKEGKYSQPFMDYYLIPMGAAIWSTPLLKMLDFPAKSFIQFFHNHGLLALKDRPHWKTVSGGSHSYIKKFISEFKGRIETQSQIEGITRKDHATQIFFHGGEKKEFDKIVIATHADQALKLLKDPSSEEQRLLEAWTYSLNETVLHWDESVMPRNKKVWASWNYRIEKESSAEQPVSLTYHMNRLQNLKTKRQYFVTLNRNIPIDESKVIRKIYYTHPNYTLKSMATQGELDKLNDANRTLFCGSYFGYGFHEDAVKAALQAVAHLGVKL